MTFTFDEFHKSRITFAEFHKSLNSPTGSVMNIDKIFILNWMGVCDYPTEPMSVYHTTGVLY